MKIGINGYEAVISRFGIDKKTNLPIRVGSSEVCFQLLVELEKIDKKNTYIVYLPQKPTLDLPKESSTWKYKIVKSKKLWTLTALNMAVNKDKLDLFFNPTHYSPLFLNCPQVISILDVSYKYFPELFKKKDLYKLSIWGKYSVKKASHIVTISDSSKDDIMKEYGVNEAKISVIPVGIKEIEKGHMTKKELAEKFNISNPYILYVGTLQPRKNLVRLIEAFSKLKENNIDLVIVGKKGWQYEEILKAPEKYEVSEKVHFLENVTNEDLSGFYEHAECFVLPSLYEGFGLPVLEAMKYGCPVVTSNISSLPEAGGDAAEYFNPEDVDDMARAIKRVVSDKQLQEKMVKKGRQHIQNFSWEKSAEKVIGIFENYNKHA